MRRAMAAFQETQQLLAEVYAPDWVWNMGTFTGWPGQAEFTGTAAFNEFLVDWIGPYREWEIEWERIEDAGEHRVVGVMRQQGRLQDSESWVDLRQGVVWTLENGLIQRVDVYATPEEGLAAAGLLQ